MKCWRIKILACNTFLNVRITLGGGGYEEVRELQPLQGIYNIATILFLSWLLKDLLHYCYQRSPWGSMKKWENCSHFKEFTILPLSHFFHDYWKICCIIVIKDQKESFGFMLISTHICQDHFFCNNTALLLISQLKLFLSFQRYSLLIISQVLWWFVKLVRPHWQQYH